ncbi:MAG: phytoene/squalene synthase family protein [Aerococcus sp.]|nr:phytoene/squalene synthase family protein [Aerococcus sp.]
MISNARQLFEDYCTDFDACERIIKQQSKSFYAAFSRLPELKAQAVYAVYAFCREADDAIDEQHDPTLIDQMSAQLDRMREGLAKQRSARQVFGEDTEASTWRALMVAFQVFDLEFEPFADLLDGQRQDVQFAQPQTETDLSAYSYYVAGSVGLMLLPILSEQAQDIQEPAKQLGEAMQRTNILRDIGRDLVIDRVYLPVETMKRFSVTHEMLERHVLNQSFIDLWEYEARLAEAQYQSAYGMVPLIDDDCREALLVAALVYRENLEVARSHHYAVFNTTKREIPKSRKLACVKMARQLLKTL